MGRRYRTRTSSGVHQASWLLFVFMGDGEYFLAKAENADEYVGCPDLAGAAIEPLDLVTGIIDITIFAGLESS